jgi:hypothetical protein
MGMGQPGTPLRKRFAVAQLPVTDLRALTVGGQRLARPSWPDPRVDADFVRSLGRVRDRPHGGADYWPGEHAFAPAWRLLDLDVGQLRLGSARERGYVQHIRLFGSEVAYRVDIGFRVWTESSRNWLDLARALLALPATISHTTRTSSLGASGPEVASRLDRLTTPHGHATRRGLVVAGRPLLLVEDKTRPSVPPQVTFSRVTVHGRGIPVCRLSGAYDSKSREPLRQLRMSLWRLHTELEALREVLRIWSASPESFHDGRLLSYLAASTKRLARNKRDGVHQPLLIALSDSLTRFDRSELARTADQLESRSKGIAKTLKLVLERSQPSGLFIPIPSTVEIGTLMVNSEYFAGDKVGGDKFRGDKVGGDKITTGDVSGNVGSHGSFTAATSSGTTSIDARTWNVGLDNIRQVAQTAPAEVRRVLEPDLVALESATSSERPSRLARIAEVARQIGEAAKPVLDVVTDVMRLTGHAP